MAAKIKPLQSRDLRHFGNLEQLVTGTDSTGAPSTSYQVFAQNIQFGIEDWKPTEAFLANAIGGQLSTIITLRYRPGLEGVATNTMRLVHQINPGVSPAIFDYYEIIGARRDPTLRQFMTLTCTRRDAPGFRTGTLDVGMTVTNSDVFIGDGNGT